MKPATKIKELMTTTNMVSARSHDSLELAAQMMTWAEIGHLPVVDNGRVVGMLAEHDLVGFADLSRQVAEVMSVPPVTVRPDDDVVVAAAEMASRGVSCLPVVEKGRLVGIVTSRDLLVTLADRLVQPLCDAASTIDAVMTREPATADVDDPLVNAANRMIWLGVRHLPVVHDGRLVGILSDRDARAALDGLGDERRVRDVMTPKPLTLTPRSTLQQAGRTLIENRIGALPVVDDLDGQRLVGIVSYVDVIRASVAPEAGKGRPASRRAAEDAQ